jgi:hypothetical protein
MGWRNPFGGALASVGPLVWEFGRLLPRPGRTLAGQSRYNSGSAGGRSAALCDNPRGDGMDSVKLIRDRIP